MNTQSSTCHSPQPDLSLFTVFRASADWITESSPGQGDCSHYFLHLLPLFRRAIISTLKYLLARFCYFRCCRFLLINCPDTQASPVIQRVHFNHISFHLYFITRHEYRQSLCRLIVHSNFFISVPQTANQKMYSVAFISMVLPSGRLFRLIPSSAPCGLQAVPSGDRTASASHAAPLNNLSIDWLIRWKRFSTPGKIHRGNNVSLAGLFSGVTKNQKVHEVLITFHCELDKFPPSPRHDVPTFFRVIKTRSCFLVRSR